MLAEEYVKPLKFAKLELKQIQLQSTVASSLEVKKSD